MVDSLGRPDLFIAKACHQESDGMKKLLRFLGCPAKRTGTEWPKFQVEKQVTGHVILWSGSKGESTSSVN